MEYIRNMGVFIQFQFYVGINHPSMSSPQYNWDEMPLKLVA